MKKREMRNRALEFENYKREFQSKLKQSPFVYLVLQPQDYPQQEKRLEQLQSSALHEVNLVDFAASRLPALQQSVVDACSSAAVLSRSLDFLQTSAGVQLEHSIEELKEANGLLLSSGNCSWLHSGYYNTVGSMQPLR